MSEPRRVGYILKQYPRLSETFVLNEILGLEQCGTEVTIFSLRHATEGRFHPQISSVQGRVHYSSPVDRAGFLAALRALPELDATRLGPVLEFTDLLPADRRSRVVLNAIEVADHVRRLGLDHLHAHFLTVAAQTAHIVHLLTGVPYTVTAHAKDIYRQTVDWRLVGRIAAGATSLVTVCDANLEFLTAKLTGSGTRVTRVYNGIEPHDDAAPLEARQRGLILGVGRLVEKKGFDVLLDAIARLRATGLEVECAIVGDGDQRAALESQAGALGVADQVTFAGAQPQHRVAEWLRRAHVMAAPCRVGRDGNQDALPTVLLEALAAGLPAVSTPVAGVPEIITHGSDGLLVPTDDPVALAAGLGNLLADDDRWRSFSAAGPRKISAAFDRRSTITELQSQFWPQPAVA